MTTYYGNHGEPGQPFTVLKSDGTVAALQTDAWTAVVQLIAPGSPDDLVVEQSTDITISNTAPNLIRTKWSTATLAAVVAYMGTETSVDLVELPVLTSPQGSKEGVRSGDPVRHTFKAIPV